MKLKSFIAISAIAACGSFATAPAASASTAETTTTQINNIDANTIADMLCQTINSKELQKVLLEDGTLDMVNATHKGPEIQFNLRFSKSTNLTNLSAEEKSQIAKIFADSFIQGLSSESAKSISQLGIKFTVIITDLFGNKFTHRINY